MRPQVVETHLVPADGFVSTLRYSRNRGYALTLRQLLHTAVGSQDSQDSSSPRSLHKHSLLRRGFRLALIRSASSTSASSKTHDATTTTTLNYARLSPSLLLLLERRNPPPSPGSLASELASHNPSSGLLSFRPRRFQVVASYSLDLQPYCCTTCHRICKLQFNPTSSRHALCEYDFAYSGILCSSDTLTQTSKQAASHMCISPMEQSIGIIAVRSNHTALHYVGHINISTDLDYDKDQTNPTPAPATQQLVLTAARHSSSLLSLQLAFSSQQQSAPAALYIDVQL